MLAAELKNLIIYRIRILKCAIASPSGSFPEPDGMIVSCGGQHNRRMRHLCFAKPSQTLTPNPPPHHQFIAIATTAIGVIHGRHQFTLGHTKTSNSEPRSSKQEASLPCFPAQAPRHEMIRSPDCLCPTASDFSDFSSRHHGAFTPTSTAASGRPSPHVPGCGNVVGAPRSYAIAKPIACNTQQRHNNSCEPSRRPPSDSDTVLFMSIPGSRYPAGVRKCPL